MKAKLLKQIRKRFEVKISDKTHNFYRGYEFFIKDKKTGLYYSAEGFYQFICVIGQLMKRYFEFSNYNAIRINRISQRKRKKQFENLNK